MAGVESCCANGSEFVYLNNMNNTHEKYTPERGDVENMQLNFWLSWRCKDGVAKSRLCRNFCIVFMGPDFYSLVWDLLAQVALQLELAPPQLAL